MGQAAKQLFQGQLTAANTTLYTAPTVNGGRARITNLILCNTDTSARDVTLNIVPSGGAVAASNRILSAATIPASTSWSLHPCDIILEPGASLQGLASVTGVVNVLANGMELT